MKKEFLSPVVSIILPENTDILTLSVGDGVGDGIIVDMDEVFQKL